MAYRVTYILSILVLLISLTGCSSVSKGMRWMSYGSPINESDLNGMIASGTRMTLEWASGETGSITYYANGMATLESGGNSTTGTWKIQEGKLCMDWSPDESSSAQCYSVYRDEGKVLKLFDEHGNHYADTSAPGMSS